MFVKTQEKEEESVILAQYTIRSKQEYIFRSNRLLDIVGGTEMIRNAFDWVFAAAEQEGVTCQPADVPFKLQAVQDAFAAGTLGMAELFRGGGNLTVLYRDRDTYLRVNRRFSRLVLENAPGMVPMAACCEANGQNYSADYSALMAAVDAEKNRMLPGRADYAAPFALRDRTTNQPIVCRVPFAGGQRELTAESRKKWEKGQRSDKRNDGNRLLDEMTTEWQEESLLAVIHADGNNMGVKIQQKLNGSIDYDFCVSTMRAFTAEIADAFTRTGETSLRDTMAYLQKEYHGLRETAYHYRIVVADGDDFTFICNARFALEYTCNYLKAVHQKKDYSSCAGICIFHSGYPVARAYTLAEQACDNAKKPVHETHAEECWLDFHYLHSGIDGNLDNIRSWQKTDALMARPWLVVDGNTVFTLEKAKALIKYIQDHKDQGTNRSNLKKIAAALEESRGAAKMELARVLYRNPDFAGALRTFSPNEDDQLKALYDITEIYDLWIAGRGK